jgi:hypothetical protein
LTCDWKAFLLVCSGSGSAIGTSGGSEMIRR